jgi:predicted RNA-binding Zn-ribbon protein involved in translation (DUF1610 family)
MMYCTPLEKPKARKAHVCMSCGQPINVGENYMRWRCFSDGGAGTNKMHVECYEMHDEERFGQWEYMPFSYERPMIGGGV